MRYLDRGNYRSIREWSIAYNNQKEKLPQPMPLYEEANKDHNFEFIEVCKNTYKYGWTKHPITVYRCKVCDLECLVSKSYVGCWKYWHQTCQMDLDTKTCGQICVYDLLE